MTNEDAWDLVSPELTTKEIYKKLFPDIICYLYITKKLGSVGQSKPMAYHEVHLSNNGRAGSGVAG